MPSWWKATLILSRISSTWTIDGTAEGAVGKSDGTISECTVSTIPGAGQATHDGLLMCRIEFASCCLSSVSRRRIRHPVEAVCENMAYILMYLHIRVVHPLCVCWFDHCKVDLVLLVFTVHSQTCLRLFGSRL